MLVALYGVTLAAALASRIPTDFFVKRVWLGIPLFAGIVVIPAIFFVEGPRLFSIAIGPLVHRASIPGPLGAILLVMRVGVSVSLAVLLVHDHALGRPAEEPALAPGPIDLRARSCR